MQALDEDQVRRLLQAAQGHRLAPLFYLAVTTGLRQGELLGLRWADLDWEARTLTIERQAQWLMGRGVVFMEPKTAAGRRPIKIGAEAIRVLHQRRAQQLNERMFAGDRWKDLDLIFTSRVGTPIQASNLLKDFQRLLAKAGLPAIRFHDLRHTAASLMLKQGVPAKVVQERLGHSNIQLTLNVYSHVLPGMQEQAADLMDALLKRRAE